MKLIVGLGNIGSEFNQTRHNVGFDVIDEMTKQLGIKLKKSKFNGLIYKDKHFIIAKPTTFMNLSGDFVLKISQFYNIKSNDILIIYDDIDCAIGQLKFKTNGSHNGQKGIMDIIQKLGTTNFNRIKIGIGRPTNKNQNISDYVLGKYGNNPEIIESINKCAKSAILFIDNDFEFIVNKYGVTK